jgi:hypothetical protein
MMMAVGRVGGVVCVDAREKVPQMASRCSLNIVSALWQFAKVCETANTDLSNILDLF